MTIKRLSEALLVQKIVLEELLDLLKRETSELTDVNIEAMTEINSKKEELGTRIQTHTAMLRQVIAETTNSMGLPSDLPFGALAAKLGQQGNKEIVLQHEQLNAVAEQVRQVAAMNQEIAGRFADALNQSLNFLTRIINQSSVYGSSGGYQQRTPGAVIINMEA